jgi:hypothetical protein
MRESNAKSFKQPPPFEGISFFIVDQSCPNGKANLWQVFDDKFTFGQTSELLGRG